MSQTKELENFALELTNNCISILIDKSEQYNPDGNYIGTFEFSAKMASISPAQSILGRMGDKMLRLSGLLKKRFSPEPLTMSDIEAIDDAIMDLINYCILMKWAIK